MVARFGMVLVLCAGFTVAGCSGGFGSDREEFVYLDSIPAPTPAQWQRKLALGRAWAEKNFTRAIELREKKTRNASLESEAVYEEIAKEFAGKAEFLEEYEKATALGAVAHLINSDYR